MANNTEKDATSKPMDKKEKVCGKMGRESSGWMNDISIRQYSRHIYDIIFIVNSNYIN